MCNIWKIPRDIPELCAQDWLDLLSEDLFSELIELDITGGEPFLRKDLYDFLLDVCALKQDHLKSLKSIAITTNGFLTRRILDLCRKILPDLQQVHVDLVMVCAMDAVGELHDRIRNYADGWHKADHTIQGLKRLRDDFPGLIIGLKTTVLPLNVTELGRIAGYADSNGLFAIVSPCIITPGRYLNPDRAEHLTFSRKDMRAIIRFFEEKSSRWSFHEDRLVRYFKTGVMKKPCSCGFNYFFIRSTGELFLCPLIKTGLGNVKQTPIKRLLASEEALRIRRRIGRFPECRRCTEPGLERYALPYEGWTYLCQLLKMGRKRFLDLHQHMGLDKYFTCSKSSYGR
jgi:sulfatase maturation enzyme AslB (radical SAM superfamily)